MPIKFPAKQSGSGGGGPTGITVDTTVANGATAAIFTLNKASVKSAWFTYDINRNSDTDPEAVRSGLLVATHQTGSDVWLLSDLIEDFDPGADTGVSFSINTSTGEVSYTSNSYDPTGYASSLKLEQISELAQ